MKIIKYSLSIDQVQDIDLLNDEMYSRGNILNYIKEIFEEYHFMQREK